MAEEVARIGIKFETADIARGKASLEALAQQGPKVEKAMAGIEGAATKTGKSLKSMAEGSTKGLDAIAKSAPQAADGLGRVAKSADDAKRALAAMRDSASGLSGLSSAAVQAAQGLRTSATSVQEMQAAARAATASVQSLTVEMARAIPSAQAVAKAQADAVKTAQDMGLSFKTAGDQMKAYGAAAQQAASQSRDGAAGMKTLSDAGGGLGANIGLAVRGIQEFMALQIVGWAKDSAMALYGASASAERLRMSLDFSSTRGSAAEIAYLRKTTFDLGLAFDSTAKAYQQFSAAARGTALEGDKARAIFESVAKASAVMGLSAENTSGVLLTLQQMISKGTVQSEDLRGQLGEHLPDAFQTAARAMGVTTVELEKMLEQGKVVAEDFLPKFAQEMDQSLGGAAEKGADRLDAAANKFDNAWQRLKQNAGDSGVSSAMAAAFNSTAGSLDAISVSMEQARSKGSGFWGQAAAAVGTMYELGNSTDRAKINMYDNAKATAEAQKELDRLQKLSEIPGNGRWLLSEISHVKRYIASLQKSKQEREAALGAGGLSTAYTEGMGNNKAIVKQREGEAAKASKAGASAAKVEQSEYQRLVATINAKIEANKAELFSGGQLTESTKLRIKLEAELEAGAKKMSAARRAEAQRLIKELKDQEDEEKAIKRAITLNDERIAQSQELAQAEAEMQKRVDAVRLSTSDYSQTVKDSIEMSNLEVQTLGMNSVARNTLIEQLRIEQDLRKRTKAIEDAPFASQEARQSEIDRVTAEAMKAKANVQTKAYVSEWEKAYDQSSQALTDALMGGGKNAGESLKDYFRTLVLRPVVQALVQPVASTIATGVTSTLGLNGGGGAGKSLMGSNSAGGLMGSFNAGMSGGWAGFEGGISMMQNGSMLSGGAQALGAAAPYIGGILQMANGNYGAGAGTMAGAYIGSIVPGIGTALGAVVGSLLGGLLDGNSRGPNHAGGVASTATTDRDTAVRQVLGSDSWGNTLGDFTSRANADLDKQLGTTVSALSGVYQQLAKFAGSTAREIDIAAGFSVNPKYSDEGAMGYFQLLDKATGEVLQKYKDRDLDKDPEKAWVTFVGDMGGALVAQLKAADIPGWMRSIFDGLGEDITVDGLNQAIQAIAVVDTAFKGWADTLQGFSGLSAEVQTALLNVSGGIEGLAGNVNAFYSGFYSEAERMGILQRQVLEQLAGLDVSVDTSTAEAAKESFRATVEGALNAGNGELAAKLLALSGNFATAADYAGKAIEEAAQSASQVLEGLMTDRRQLEAELMQAQGNATGYAAAMRAIATEGFTPAEIAAYDYNEALRDQIDVMTEAAAAAERAASERMGLETRLLTLQGDTAALRQRELAALDASNRALQLHIWAIEDAQAAYTAATTAAQGAYSGLERSVGAQKSVLQEQYNAQKAALQEQSNAAKAAWQAQISAAQEAASEMGSIASMLGNAFGAVKIDSPALSRARLQTAQSLIVGARDRNDVRAAGLEDALGVASGDTARMYGKWEEWAFAQGVTAAAVGDLYGEAQKQLSAQEQLIAQLQASDGVAQAISDAEMAALDALYQQELGLLDATLETGKSQLNALLGIDDSVLSVADAVAKLSMSMNAAEAARQSVAAAMASAAATGEGGGGATPAPSYSDEQLRAMGLDPADINARFNWLKGNGATSAVSPGELVQSMLLSGQTVLQGILNTQTNTDKFGNVYENYADFLGKFTDAQIIQASQIAALPSGVDREDYLRKILEQSINGSHADGLPYVPFDNYIAQLHKGERVLTAEENRLYTPNFSALGGGSGVIQSLVAEIAKLQARLAEISANTNATAAWVAATDRKLNRVIRNNAIATTPETA